MTVRIVDSSEATALTCTVWASADHFRTGEGIVSTAKSQPTEDGPECRLQLPNHGTYAVGVMDDANGNGRIDTNLFGIPTEGWGTSRDVQPTFRAPTFDESAVHIESPTTLTVTIRR